jgi:hypothetical protein
MEYLVPVLTSLATSIPLFIVWLIGIAVALSRWRRHPRVSLFAVIAFAVMIGSMVVFRVIYILAPLMMRERGWSPSEVGTIFGAIGIVSALINAAAWALILSAIFGWRARPEKENLFPPPPPVFGNEPRKQDAPPGFSEI